MMPRFAPGGVLPCSIGLALLALALMTGGCKEMSASRAHPPELPQFAARTVSSDAEGGPEVVRTIDLGRPEQPRLIDPQIDTGTGQLIAQASDKNPSFTETDDTATLNFVNADIREVVATILGNILKLNYVIDPAVKGTITVQTGRPLPKSALIPTLEQFLAVNGAALIKANGTFKVVPLENAAKGIAPPQVAPALSSDGSFGIYIFPLKFASATTLMKVLEPFVPKGRELRIDSTRNVLIFPGTSAEAQNLQDLISTFDVDLMKGMSFAIFPVEFTDPETIASELTGILGQEKGPLNGVVQFLPLQRLNAVLVITPQPKYLDTASTWIKRLDRRDDVTPRTYVYHVQNGRAADLADVLSQVFGATGGGEQSAPQTPLAPGLESVSTTGRPASGLRGPNLPPSSMGPLAGAATVSGMPSSGMGLGESQPLTAAPAGLPPLSAAAPPPPAMAEAAPGGGNDKTGNIRIVADDKNNALVILTTPSQYRLVESALKQLDNVPLQVLIEATIAEVSLNDELKYGIEWFLRSGQSSFTFSSLATGAVSSAFPGFSYLLNSANAQAVLNALTNITDVRVISSPQLMVVDNAPARLQVGDQVPIAVQSAVSVINPDSPIVNSIQYRDTGVILEVVPRVNANGLVFLEIIQEVSDVVPTTTSKLDSPTIQQRQIESRVAVQSGETVALGGLIRDSQSNAVIGVPILSEIPILGSLFKTTDNTIKRTELLVLLTPRVVKNRQDFADVTEELRSRLHSLLPLEMKIR
jgi:general secretion pathway protein D